MTLTTGSETAAGAATMASLVGKYLTFALGRESYGITVLKIREIIQRVPITAMPNMPDYIKGVINLRGKIIPVVDLRMRFGMPEAASTDQTCIIVVNVTIRPGPAVLMGLIVDAVAALSPSRSASPVSTKTTRARGEVLIYRTD